MSMPTNTDLTEEDAADLQFPKESHALLLDNKCGNCENILSDRYILCAQCDETFCVYCFANGAEMRQHRSDHPYKVINHDFNLFPNSDWTAKEELALLDGLLSTANWQAVAKNIPNRNAQEVKQHYDYYYLQRGGSTKLPVIDPPDEVSFSTPLMPFRLKTNDLLEPLRASDNTHGGYSAARSDFEYEYDRNAEDMVAKLEPVSADDPDYELLTDLQMGVLNIYRRRLGERQRRKAILREHGLIMPQKTKSWLQRYYATLTSITCEKLTRFMQFYSGEKFVYFIEGLHRIGELKIHISKLSEYRRLGMKTLEEAKLYLKLSKHREMCMKDLRRFQQASELTFKYKQPVSLTLAPKRRGLTPLDILGLPGYEKITENERDLCRTIRLSPDMYLDFKNILIQENNKMGYLKLLTARRVLKIDVNKTRKLYDFLISEGHIVSKERD